MITRTGKKKTNVQKFTEKNIKFFAAKTNSHRCKMFSI